MEATCKICGHSSEKFDDAKILKNYTINYYHCALCGFVQTDEPYWLEKAYENAIASLDTGIVQRNIENANSLLFLMKFIPNGTYMDFGGGNGMLTRMMRDYGFDFYHYDKYAYNEYARGFEANFNTRYTLITAFENFEHLVDPLIEVNNLMRFTDRLFFSTNLIAEKPPLVKDWWYYAPIAGQHISFFSLKTLKFIAKKYECQLLTDGNSLHILSKVPIRKNFFKLLKLYNKIRNTFDITKKFRKESKINKDFEMIHQIIIEKNIDAV